MFHPVLIFCVKTDPLFDIVQIRREAIQALEGWTQSQSLKQIILIAKKYDIVSWLKAAYTQLEWSTTLPFDELIDAPAIDWETLARLLYIKHIKGTEYRAYVNKCPECKSGRICCGVVDEKVEEVFKDEFKKMKKAQETEDPPRSPSPLSMFSGKSIPL
jgi:hypothetical protein